MVQFLNSLEKQYPNMKNLIMTSLFLLALISANAQDNRTIVLQDLEKNQQTVQQSDQQASLTATLKSASRLFEDQNDLTSVILIIPSGSVVDVLESDSTYFHVVYEGSEGYIFKHHAVINKASTDFKPQATSKEEPVQEAQPVQQEEESRFSYLENKYGTSMATKLISGKIWKGMSSEMVRDSWGNPQKINRVISGNTVKEEWIYKNTWLYIQDDYLGEWGPIR